MRSLLALPVACLVALSSAGAAPPHGPAPASDARARDARAAFAFAASFARQRAERPTETGHDHRIRGATNTPDDGVRVWTSRLPTYYPGQPEPVPPIYPAPVFAPVYVEPFAPALRRVGGTGCVTVGGRTT